MQYKRLSDKTQVSSHMALMNREPYIVIDTETTGLDPFLDRIVDIQVSGPLPDEAYIFSAEFAPCLSALDTLLVGHNFKFDLHMLYRAGVDLTSKKWHDTMLIHHLVDENASHALDDIIKERWNDPYKEEFWAKYGSYLDAPESVRDAYACKDVIYCHRFYCALQESLISEEIPQSLVMHVHRLAYALLDTEILGIGVDTEYLTAKGAALKGDIERLKPQMRALVNTECESFEMKKWLLEMDKRKTDKGKANVPRPEFSFDSAPQLMKLLYEELALPVQKNEKTKQPSVNYDSLKKLEDKHPVVPLLLEYAGQQMVYNTFIEGTLEKMKDGRIYPSFNVNGTTTGRISHSSPNMGNLPSQGGVRGIFRPDNGNVLLSADYSQLEVCLAAHFSRDAALLRIVLDGASQHDITAESLAIPRSAAKTLNFAMQYRCSSFKVAKMLSVSQKEGQLVWNKYWETYSGLKALMDECDHKVNEGQPIVSPFGRKRRFEVKKRAPWDKAYRQAFNALIQGTGGDIMSRAFYQMSKTLSIMEWGRAWFTVHDEALIEVKAEYAEQAEKELKRTMIGVGEEIKLTVPLSVQTSGAMSRWED